jgi:hypothetical protein
MTNRKRRQAFDIRFRCTLSGRDWTARLWLRDPTDAFDAMYRRLAYSAVRGSDSPRYSKNFYRVVDCDLSADQTTRGVE